MKKDFPQWVRCEELNNKNAKRARKKILALFNFSLDFFGGIRYNKLAYFIQ